ncbi:MAG: CDP-glycerol glycerophosphotransferase family protein [Bdellovibrionales bacterium]
MDTPPFKQFEERIAALEQKFNTHVAAQSLAKISKIYPKTNTVVFVGLTYFGDNIKYAYLAFWRFAKGKDIACTFLTEDPLQIKLLKAAGLPFLTSKDPQYLPTLFGAKIAVLQDVFNPQQTGVVAHALLQGAKFIQLWHGIPLKEIGLKSHAQIEVMEACGPYEAMVATNASSKADWAQRFSFRELAPIGYPRDDVFFRDNSSEDLINVDNESLLRLQEARRAGKPVILYAPTFRDHSGVAWFEKAALPAFAKHCRTSGAVLCINLHPGEQGTIAEVRARYPELWFIAPHTDIYPLVKEVDVLVTDYSSLAFDFLLLNRSLIFYRPDHAEYISKSRPLIAGRDHYTAGSVTFGVDELIAATEAALAAINLKKTRPFAAKQKALRKELFDHCDGKAGNRFCRLIMELLES